MIKQVFTWLKQTFVDCFAAGDSVDYDRTFWSKKQWFWLLLAQLVILTVIIIVFDIPYRDTALRYAPMADAIASGNFEYAFHPRVPLLAPLLAGILSFFTGIDGFLATKIVSVLTFFAAFFVVTALMKRVFGNLVGALSGIFFLSCPDLIRIAFSGERDAGKSLLLAAIVYALIGVYQNREKLSGYLLCGICCGLSVLVRIEMVFVAAVALSLVMLLECRRTFVPWRSFLAFGAAIIGVAPAIAVSICYIGSAVPDSYTAKMVLKVLGRNIYWYESLLAVVGAMLLLWVAGLVLRPVKAVLRRYLLGGAIVLFIAGFAFYCYHNGLHFEPRLWRYFQRFVKGLFSVYYPFLAVALLWNIVKKRWSVEQTLLMLIFVMHVFGVVAMLALNGRLYISPRYLVSALPLLFGWCGVALITMECLTSCLPKFLKKTWHVLLVIGYLGCTLHGVFPAFEAYIPRKDGLRRKVLLTFAADIRELEANRKIPPNHKKPKFNLKTYNLCYPATISFRCWQDGKFNPGGNRATAISYMAKVRGVKNHGDYFVVVKPLKAEVKEKKFGKKLIRKMSDADFNYELWSNIE